MSKSRFSGAAAKLQLDGQIRAARAAAAGDAPTIHAYERLLDAFRPRTSTLSNVALFAMATHHAAWIGAPETWSPPDGRGEHRALASLAAHLLARFAMPACMANAWLAGELGERRPEHAWYIRLGRGENIRRVGVPMPITRALAHRFASAPAHLSVIAALRWAQLRVLDATAEITDAAVESSLGRTLEHEKYWATVLQFFVNHPELSAENVGPIVDFLRARPLAMRGRSLAALMRSVNAWHHTLADRRRAEIAWSPACFSGLSWTQLSPDAEPRVWTIDELCTSRELIEEGRAMRHCVGSYTSRCTQGKSSIWSMQLETSRSNERVLTIEVDVKNQQIIQARRKCNGMPNTEEREVLARWAAREHLGIIESLR